MGPEIQLIQLSLRVEREAEAQRRPYMAYRDGFADEEVVRPRKQSNRIKGSFNLFRRRQLCECA
jgi:hypothetical protein